MTDITALARKADHPFDDEAIMAANIAWSDAHKAYMEKGEGGIGYNDGPIAAALTAAFKSMKDRGMAREGVATEKHGAWLARSQDHPGSNCMFVTIIRHKENGDG